MGAKTAILAYIDGNAGQQLGRSERLTVEVARQLVNRIHPDRPAEQLPDATLADEVWPSDDHTYVAAFAGVYLVCDQRFAVERPSQLAPHLFDLAAGRRVLLHTMHSGSDALAIGVWEAGQLRRALGVRSGTVVENVGPLLPFEAPYWRHHDADGETTSVPIRPLDLGEAALRAWFGFALEGEISRNQIDPDDIPVYGFRTADPTGAEQATRQALLEQFRRTHTLRRYSMGPDGTLVEIIDA
ncbi:DUF6928 family protein [Plantactinospora endophytica]|uniref:Uncharacterized protein n=1 Tax=Plantactinospora endophytica TaxID=673535 RepID=A0ABQ4E1T6_9ACTN|nr:hypothetical protein [Plantactinospora endophytica]GIG88674.1 hypothetical protein Pen02_36100 [Plantactinospora endophytica]